MRSVQKIEYNFLLAILRKAEGIAPYSLIIDCYLEAAKELIPLQNRYEKGGANASTQIVFLEAARCIKARWEKTLDLERKWNGAHLDKVREGEAALQQLPESVSCLSMLDNLVSLLKTIFRDRVITALLTANVRDGWRISTIKSRR